jgi:hypothetical protein
MRIHFPHTEAMSKAKEAGTDASESEAGVALILVLVFLLAIGLILVALATAASDDLVNSNNLAGQRSLEYAADGATTLAAQSVRYSGQSYSTTPTSCLPGGSVTINKKTIYVDCTYQSPPNAGSVTRAINFYACGTAAGCSSSNAIVQAQVYYNDYPPGNGTTPICTPGGETSTCGTAMTINSWIVETGNN